MMATIETPVTQGVMLLLDGETGEAITSSTRMKLRGKGAIASHWGFGCTRTLGVMGRGIPAC